MAARKKAKAPRRKTGARKTAGRKKVRKVVRKKTPARKKRARKSTGTPARKKSAGRSGARKKSPARRKSPARKKTVARKKATVRRKSAAKKTARRKAAPKKAAPKAPSPKKKAAPSLEPLARKIIRAATETAGLRELYAADATSAESGQAPIVGHEALEAKLAGWESIQKKAVWKAKHTFVSGDAIAIEWAAEVTMNDGRVVHLNEMAVHEIKGGKIAAERYYYDPSALGGGAAGAEPEPPTPAPPSPEPVVSLPPGRDFAEQPTSPSLSSGSRSISEPEPASSEATDDDEKKVDPFDL